MTEQFTLERRTVLRAGAVTGVVAATGLVASPAEAAALPSRATLTALVGRTFTTVVDGRTVRLRLVAVTDGGFRPRGLSRARRAAWRRSSYQLAFRSPADLQQGTVTLRHPRTGSFRLFLVPGVRSRGRTPLDAVVNRWKG